MIPQTLSPLLIPAHCGQALPDRVQVSVIADSPRATGCVWPITTHADRFFRAYAGAKPYRGDKDPSGPGYTLCDEDATLTLHTRDSFSMTVIINPQRLAAERHGLPGARQRHGNTVMHLLTEGYDLPGLRRGMCQDISDIVARAKARYAELVPKALGVPVIGEVYANWSQVELVHDRETDPAIMGTYDRAFRKLMVVSDEATSLSGGLRKGERFALYSKKPIHSEAPIVRFEMSITGEKIKFLPGRTQRVPAGAEMVARVFDAIEARYTPIWLEIERHRQPQPQANFGSVAVRLPRSRDLYQIGCDLADCGRIAANKGNRSALATLARRGLIQNPWPLTKVRATRITTPESDPFWRRWRERL